jgi:hypothetical protein
MAELYKRRLVTLLAVTLLSIACTPRPVSEPLRPECLHFRPLWLNVPIIQGHPDPTLVPGTGGLALRPMDGATGSAIDGAQFVLTSDTTSADQRETVGAITRQGVALLRDVKPGWYGAAFQSLGFQGFRTHVQVPAGRVDTIVVTVYPVPICLM